MDIQQPKKREKVEDEHKAKQGQPTNQQQQSSPPSSTSSPSHEFSFTISLHSSTAAVPDKTTKSSPPSFAIDLSPADDIFFHGHLLPLTLLSHLPISPRSSTNSLDSFTIPVGDLLEEPKLQNLDENSTSVSTSNTTTTTTTSSNSNKCRNVISSSNNSSSKKRSNKVRSFSIFSRWRKGCEVGEREMKDEEEETIKKKRKVRFNVSHILKRYIRIIRPILVFRGGRRDKGQLRRQPYSFSGNLAWKGKQELRGRRGEYSAPASMWTSPTNSGLLVATPLPSSKSDSTMEELQSAIQAAIAHCKNSIAIKEEKLFS